MNATEVNPFQLIETARAQAPGSDAADLILALAEQLELAHRKLATEARNAPRRSSFPLDLDTVEKGHDGPFETWESDHTSLVHVLWSARHAGLNLFDDADMIGSSIMRSRWLTAQRQNAISSGDPVAR